jgi:hypothetical protein
MKEVKKKVEPPPSSIREDQRHLNPNSKMIILTNEEWEEGMVQEEGISSHLKTRMKNKICKFRKAKPKQAH